MTQQLCTECIHYRVCKWADTFTGMVNDITELDTIGGMFEHR